MSMPLRKGAWIFFTSAVEAAPQRTASRKASSLSGGSKPVGSGRATFSMTLAPGSISQMTCSSSPRPSSSTEASVSRCCGPAKVGLRAAVGSVLGRTSLTIHCRERTLTSWPCSGGLVTTTAMLILRTIRATFPLHRFKPLDVRGLDFEQGADEGHQSGVFFEPLLQSICTCGPRFSTEYQPECYALAGVVTESIC